MSRFFKSAAFPILIVVVLAFFASKLVGSTNSADGADLRPDDDADRERRRQERHARSEGQQHDCRHDGEPRSTRPATRTTTSRRSSTTSRKHEGGAALNVQDTSSSGWISLLTYLLPFVIFIGFWLFLMNQVQGGGSKVMSFGKSRAKRMSVDSPKITLP